MDLIDRIDRWSQVDPDRVAHVSGVEAMTYAELARRSDVVAAHLASALPDDRSPVVVLGHKEPEMLVAFLATVKARHPYVPVDTVTPAHRLDHIKDLAGARLVLTPARVQQLVGISASSPDMPHRLLDPDDPFYVMFTSGSTGEPKGVVITLGCLTSFVDWMLAEQGPAELSETYLNQAPFSFDLSVMDVYMSLASGGTLFSLRKDEIASLPRLFRSLAASNVTIWVSTPSFARMCLAEKTFGAEMLPRLKRLLFCGETLAPEVAAELLDRFPAAEVWNTYGPTEATVATTSVRIDRSVIDRYSPLPVGYPKPGTRVLVCGDDDRPLPEGERGEIVIAGPNVSVGYIGRAELTARAFCTVDGMRAYRTGDLGRYQEGLLFFEGRRDNQIKLHGYRIELGDVEANLRSLPGVQDCVVIPKLKAGQADYLAAFIILSEPSALSEFELGRAFRQQLAGRVPPYMVPQRFHFLPSFPMTANGKADRRRLAETLT